MTKSGYLHMLFSLVSDTFLTESDTIRLGKYGNIQLRVKLGLYSEPKTKTKKKTRKLQYA